MNLTIYHLNKNRKLPGGVLTHVNDFTITRMGVFIEKILDGVSRLMTVSQVDKDRFKYMGQDIEAFENNIEISMLEYEDSLEDVVDIRKAQERYDPLSDTEKNLYQKMT